MSKFKATTRRFPCEICDTKDGKCSKAREGKELWNCYYFHSPQDTPVTPEQNGQVYIHIGAASDPLWSKWLRVPADSVKPKKPENHSQSNLLALPAARPAPALKQRPVLPIRERDKLYTQLLDALELDGEADLLDLVERGIDLDQAHRWGFRSVDEQTLPETLAEPALPGIARKAGRLTLYTKPGYLCPCKDARGRIQGFQVKTHTGGYRWLSSPAQGGYEAVSSSLSNGELPLSVCTPLDPEGGTEALDTSAVAFAEGTGAKPFILAQALEIPVIGAAGGNWASSPQGLRAALQHFSPDQVYLYPDAGAILNPSVLGQYMGLEALLREWGYTLKYAWWGQVLKGDTDPDNVELDDLMGGSLNALTPKDFAALAKAINLDKLRAACVTLGINSEQIPASYNQRLSPGTVQPERLELRDLLTLRKDLETRVERRRLVTRVSRILARKRLSWAALAPWLEERRYSLKPKGENVDKLVDVGELITGRFPKTAELRELARNLEAIVSAALETQEAARKAQEAAKPGLEVAEPVKAAEAV